MNLVVGVGGMRPTLALGKDPTVSDSDASHSDRVLCTEVFIVKQVRHSKFN